ncbi:MAG: trypsin, partial [Pyrinomonadaceae bacterium]|nr:trypsin [Pyrinomonadaceae bacterium]
MNHKLLCVIALCLFALSANAQGELNAVSKKGKTLGACPLKHTDVQADISGSISRVKVTQEFENNFTEPIEAVYIFPLPQNSAVDAMTMKIGERVIKGKILKREEAKQVYETAKNQGQAAALLDQERANIFTQAVANILPNEKVTIEITFVETLKYENGSYEFVFPTVVAPRYNPSQVVDAKAITPNLAPTDVRAGHDISIMVNLDAGVPVENVAAKSHEIETMNLGANRAVIKLKDLNEIPNRDFVLRYDVTGKRIEDA